MGPAALAIGLLWIGQGAGVVASQKTSFMIDQMDFVPDLIDAARRASHLQALASGAIAPCAVRALTFPV